MALDPQFKTVGTFEADSPLDRQIQDLQDNAARAFGRVARQAADRLAPTVVKTAAYAAQLGDIVRAQGTFSIVLPAPSAQNQGREIDVLVETAGTVTVLPTTGLVQGAASDALATTGLRRYVAVGTGWWR